MSAVREIPVTRTAPGASVKRQVDRPIRQAEEAESNRDVAMLKGLRRTGL